MTDHYAEAVKLLEQLKGMTVSLREQDAMLFIEGKWRCSWIRDDQAFIVAWLTRVAETGRLYDIYQKG